MSLWFVAQTYTLLVVQFQIHNMFPIVVVDRNLCLEVSESDSSVPKKIRELCMLPAIKEHDTTQVINVQSISLGCQVGTLCLVED